MLVFKNAVNEGLIKHDPINGYVYNSIPLGHNEAEAHKYITTNVALLSALNQQVKELVANEEARKLIPSTGKAHSNEDEITALKKKIAELEAEKSNQVPSFDGELSSLQEQAKALGIKAPHLYKDKEQLKSKIEEAKNK